MLSITLLQDDVIPDVLITQDLYFPTPYTVRTKACPWGHNIYKNRSRADPNIFISVKSLPGRLQWPCRVITFSTQAMSVSSLSENVNYYS